MSIDASIRDAIRSLIVSARLQERATLVGGQAIRDWHAAQVHALTGVGISIPPTRSTTDVDVYFAIEESDREPLHTAIDQGWEPLPDGMSDRGAYRYRWRSDSTVTLDLVETKPPLVKTLTKTLVKVSHGPGIAAVRVLPPWIVDCHLVERSFTPAFAQLGIHRLTRLGLVASKLQAVHTAVQEYITAAAESRTPATWTERLQKDLQDLELLLVGRTWVAPLWEPRYRLQAAEINLQWNDLREGLCNLRDRPASMPELSYLRLKQSLAPLIPVQLG